MNAFSIDYSLVAEADLSGFKQYDEEQKEKAKDREEKEKEKDKKETEKSRENEHENDEECDDESKADAKFGYKPFEFEVIQNYNPIYGLFFKMREANYNRVGLNHNYRIRDYGKNGLWNLTGPSGEVVESPVHFKFSPLIDHLTFMTTPTDLSGISLPTCDDNCDADNENRLLRHNNMAYTDGFFYFLSSKMMHAHNFAHGVDFYGSFVGIQRVFKFDMWDDMYESISDSKYFNEHLGKKFFLNFDDEFVAAQNDYSTWSRANRPALQFSAASADELEAELGCVVCDCVVSQIEQDIIVQPCELQPDEDIHIVEKTNDVDADEEEEEEESTDDGEGMDEEEEDDDDDDDDEEFDTVEAYIPNYPVHMICIEKCEGLLEDLLKDRELDDMQCISAMTQVVFALLTYQRAFQLTHNDLHTRNIMYSSTDAKYLFYRYNNQTYRVPTHGRVFKIIDFGRAIYKYRGKVLCSDSYSPDGEAEKLYNTEPYFDANKKRVDPNPSFDLCRLATSVFDLSESRRDLPMFRDLIRRWCMDDRGKNVYMKNGSRDERYPGFKLYMMIARTVHAHTPVSQLKQKEFKRFLYRGDISGKPVMDIDAIPNYTV